MKELQKLLRDLTELLNSLKEKKQIKGYCLIGGMGIGSRGIPRATKDIDFLISAEENLLQKILSHKFKSKGFSVKVYKGDIDDPLKNLIRISDEEGNFLVDFILTYWKWEEEMVSSAEIIQLETGLNIPIARTEDLIILKLKAGSVRDLLDAEELIKIANLSKSLDQDRLSHLAKRAKVDRKLKGILKKIGS